MCLAYTGMLPMASGAEAHVGGLHGFPKKFSGAWLWLLDTYRGIRSWKICFFIVECDVSPHAKWQHFLKNLVYELCMLKDCNTLATHRDYRCTAKKICESPTLSAQEDLTSSGSMIHASWESRCHLVSQRFISNFLRVPFFFGHWVAEIHYFTIFNYSLSLENGRNMVVPQWETRCGFQPLEVL